MSKVLVFDMDGTVADLYGIDNWLELIKAYDETPYVNARPLYDMDVINVLLKQLQVMGWEIMIVSWLSKETTKEYDKKVRRAKRDWLKQYDFPFDKIHLVKYGTPKADFVRDYDDISILFDDNLEVRNAFNNREKNRYSVNANEDIIKTLMWLIEAGTR